MASYLYPGVLKRHNRHKRCKTKSRGYCKSGRRKRPLGRYYKNRSKWATRSEVWFPTIRKFNEGDLVYVMWGRFAGRIIEIDEACVMFRVKKRKNLDIHYYHNGFPVPESTLTLYMSK